MEAVYSSPNHNSKDKEMSRIKEVKGLRNSTDEARINKKKRNMQQSPNQPSNTRIESYSSKQSLALGVVQLILGGTCLMCQIGAMVNMDMYTIIGAGLWGGVLIMVAGGLGIGAAKGKTTPLIISFMIISILACVSTGPIIICASLSLITRNYPWPSYNNDNETLNECVLERCNRGSREQCTYTRDKTCELREAINSILVLCGVTELVVAIWASALCCDVTCCGSRQETISQGQLVSLPTSEPGQMPTSVLPTAPSTAIGSVQYAVPGQMLVFHPSTPTGQAFPLNYAPAASQLQGVHNNARERGQQEPSSVETEARVQPRSGDGYTQLQFDGSSKSSVEEI